MHSAIRAVWIAAFATAALAGCGGGSGSANDGTGSGTGGGSGSTGGGGGSGSGAPDGGAYQAGPGPQGGAQLYAGFRAGKALVLHQRELNAITPAVLRDRLASMELTLTAFDGVFLKLPNTTDAITRATLLRASTIASDLEPLYALRPARLKYNFAVMTVQNDLDPFDDWSVALANVRSLAKVARDAGLVGIVVDDESLAGLRVNYPYDFKNGNTRTEAEYRAQTQAIGRQIMQTITAEFPDAVVVVLRGPAGAEPKSSPALVNCVSRDIANASPGGGCGANPASPLGSFFAGFVEGASARALLVDGGIDYGLRTAEQFAGSADWRKNGIASAATDSAFIPETLRAAWPTAVKTAFGVRELDGARGNGLPSAPALFAVTAAAALRATDSFVWASFDLTDLTKAAANQPFVKATVDAKALAASTTATLAPTAPGSGTGLMGQFFSQVDESELAQTIVDATIDNVWSGTGPGQSILSGQNDNFSVVWSGYLEAPTTGTYGIFGTTDDGMQITIGSTLVVDAFYYQAPTEHAGSIDLVAGRRYPVRIRYFQGGGETEAHFAWQPPGGAKGAVPTQYLYPYR